jgi:hypothetical protein
MKPPAPADPHPEPARQTTPANSYKSNPIFKAK